jgi:5-methylcytosine-specific restriction endonuclease McrA
VAITQQYQDYLNSNTWKQKRLKVLNRAKFTCERCKKKQATQIHHLTYDRIFNEKLSDLQAVCGKCHMAIHGIKEGKKKRVSLRFFKRVKKVYQRVIGQNDNIN